MRGKKAGDGSGGTQAKQHIHGYRLEAHHSAIGLRQRALNSGAACKRSHRCTFLSSNCSVRLGPIVVLAARTALVLAISAGAQQRAYAQGKLEATYRITFARVSVGNVKLAADVGENDYSVMLTGRAGGAMRFLLDGEALLEAHGAVSDNRLQPRTFISNIKSENASEDVTMSFANGDVTELAVRPPAGIEVSEAQRRGVIDPLTALLISSEANAEDLSPAACRHTLPVFDGRHRYNLDLGFKRLDKISAPKGYSGSAIVCSLRYQPLAGYPASAPLVKYLSDGREMEVVLAPIAGARLLAPFRVSVPGMLANLLIEAERFEVQRGMPSAVSPAAGPSGPSGP